MARSRRSSCSKWQAPSSAVAAGSMRETEREREPQLDISAAQRRCVGALPLREKPLADKLVLKPSLLFSHWLSLLAVTWLLLRCCTAALLHCCTSAPRTAHHPPHTGLLHQRITKYDNNAVSSSSFSFCRRSGFFFFLCCCFWWSHKRFIFFLFFG